MKTRIRKVNKNIIKENDLIWIDATVYIHNNSKWVLMHKETSKILGTITSCFNGLFDGNWKGYYQDLFMDLDKAKKYILNECLTKNRPRYCAVRRRKVKKVE